MNGITVKDIQEACNKTDRSFEHAWRDFSYGGGFVRHSSTLGGRYVRHRPFYLAPYIPLFSKLRDEVRVPAGRQFLASLIIDSMYEMGWNFEEHGAEMLPVLPSPEQYKEWVKEADPPPQWILPTIRALHIDEPLSDEWMESFGEIGKAYPLLYMIPHRRVLRSPEQYESLALQFSEHYKRDSSRHGLLPWIAGFIVAGTNVCVEIPIDSNDETITAEERFCALIIRLARGGPSREELRMLAATSARALASSEPYSRKGFCILCCLDRHLTETWPSEYLSEVLQAMSPDHAQFRGQCVTWLDEYLASRKSPLHDRSAIEKLGLVNALLP